MANQTATLQAIYRYPVKGLSPEKLERTGLAVGKTIPCDRRYAIENGPSARLKIVKRIVRCAATEVDPDTGIRDLAIPRTIMNAYGHADCGVYAEVVQGGAIAAEDTITINP